MASELPPGQRIIDEFPRFGLNQYADRYRKNYDPAEILISGDIAQSFVIDEAKLSTLDYHQISRDFHCVTTWTKQDLNWGGVKFKDFYEQIIQPYAQPDPDVKYVIFRSIDGFRAIMHLEDLCADDVLLADQLNGEKLCSSHGAPLRLIAPAHYGYKNVKHLKAIEFWTDDSKFKPPMLKFMSHPRARVEKEERGLWFPGWFLRYLYRPFVKPTIRNFKKNME